MNFNLADFNPMPKITRGNSGQIEPGRIMATIRPIKNRPGFVSIYVGVEVSVVNQSYRYEPCTAKNIHNVIVLKPCDTGAKFTFGSKSKNILTLKFERNEDFLPAMIKQELHANHGKRLILKSKQEGDIYFLYIDNQITLFN